MPRPRFVPTEERRRTVMAMSGYGIKHKAIATVLGLRSEKTLRKYFRKELDRGAIDAMTQVFQTLYQMATSGKHVAATIFWIKTRGGLREIHVVEARPAGTPDFVVMLEKKAA